MSLTRTQRGLAVAATAAMAAVALTSCSTGNESPEAGGSGGASSDSCVIGMTQINQTAVFFTEMNAGAQEAADELGCELNITNANNDSARQSSDIENFVTQGVDALIVVAIDVNGVQPAVTAAQAQGIPVIAIDAEVEGVDTFVGVDNTAAGAEAAAWAIEEGLISGQSYGVVNAKSSFIQNQREDSFRAAIDKAGATHTQSVNGDNVQEKAATAAQDLVTAQPDMNFIYTTGEPATVGAVAALSGKDTSTTIIGWDLTAEVIAGIDSGLVRAVIQQDPRQEGTEAVKEIKAILDGAEPSEFIDVPITMVTSDNVDEFREIFN
ncbi:substrate-binding domain-containing protein [Leucobacter chromiireducens]|uniref:Sugar ABC transporter substrate-binding protein n=1 Tax=Leucobacter chromiireducens subsp. solipictus TaxID=398235 RepID=A0ABS1SKX8_9MICO|nr:substrate-binding domain-containing protein [Leucobacter chromiireducens]MBL3679938.1 sugar ABC transporter substrate-binding protein [Leucobacter chromiireducens subsp. solipictus]